MDEEKLLADCDVAFFRSPGPGGQHKNKTLSSVRLRHRPTGIEAIGRRRRSRARNMADALERLREKLEAHFRVRPPRRRTKPTRASRERRRQEKRRRGELKRSRSGKGCE